MPSDAPPTLNMVSATWDDAGNLQIVFDSPVDTYTDPGGYFFFQSGLTRKAQSSAGIVFGGTAVDARWEEVGPHLGAPGLLTYVGDDGEISSTAGAPLISGSSCPITHI